MGVSLSRVGKLLLLALATLVLFALLVMMFGTVEGEEFSPQRFERRRYYFYCLPFTRWQISPTFGNNVTGSLESTLLKDKLVRTVPQVPARWDLVSVGDSLRVQRAIAALLTDVLDGYAGFGWEEWTKANPARAQLLWPAIQEMAELDAYELIPDLLDFVLLKTPDAEFPAQLRRHLNQAYASLADDYSREGREDPARQLREAADRYAATP